jgi:hypothetical protein
MLALLGLLFLKMLLFTNLKNREKKMGVSGHGTGVCVGGVG